MLWLLTTGRLCVPSGRIVLIPTLDQYASFPGLPGQVAPAGDGQSASAASALSPGNKVRMFTVYVSLGVASQPTRTNRQRRRGVSVARAPCQQADLAREALGGREVDGLAQGHAQGGDRARV